MEEGSHKQQILYKVQSTMIRVCLDGQIYKLQMMFSRDDIAVVMYTLISTSKFCE